MNKIFKIASIVTITLFIFSCNTEKSLQQYLVETQDKSGFIKFDIPTSFLQPKAGDVSEEVSETLKSIRKINLLLLKAKPENKDAYETEKNELKKIFKNKTYKSLISMKAKGMNVKIYYTGKTDQIDEVIAFGYSEEVGVGVARLLGNNMNPTAIIKIMDDIKMDNSSLNLESLSGVFSGK